MRNLIARILTNLGWPLGVGCLLLLGVTQAQAATYANMNVANSWIDASTHTKVGYNTSPYRFNSSAGCGVPVPILDDTLSDEIPIGFNFTYGGMVFSTLRIMTNGRLQFNNNMTCYFGSPVQTLPYPDASLNYTMCIYGNDLDPTLKSDVTASTYNTTCTNRATCYISYATIGATPNRSFVVTWNNVPEWTSGGSPQGAYNLQVILQENGEFIYQYGDSTAGPSAGLAQIGWQVDTGDYEAPQIGLPLANTALKFYIPAPAAEYRMEQSSWSSAAGQVIDTSGNNRNASILGSAQTASSGRVGRAADIPINTGSSTIGGADENLDY